MYRVADLQEAQGASRTRLSQRVSTLQNCSLLQAQTELQHAINHGFACLQAPVLLTQGHVQERVKLKVQAKVVMADAEWQQIAGQPTSSPGVPADPKRLMYMIFTSGKQAGLAFCKPQHASI